MNWGEIITPFKFLVKEESLKQFLSNLWNNFRNSQYVRSVAVLGTGTIIAQVMSIAASPVQTRLYTPADFGVAALFASIVGSIVTIVCGKYDMAIVVAKKLEHSRQLLGIAFQFAIIVSLLSLLVFFVVGDFLIDVFNAELLGNWLYLVPVMLLLTGILTAFDYYSNRIQKYNIISQSKVLLTAIGLTASIIFGLLGKYYGLMLSSVLATAVVVIWLGFRYREVLNSSTLLFNKQKGDLIRQYSDFPIYNATTALLNGVTLALPVFFLSHYFPEAVVGYYALVLRVAKAPVQVFSRAVSKVNLKKVSDLANHNQPIRPYLLKVTFFLLVMVFPFAVLMILTAPSLFAWVFGDQWREAGVSLQILMPSLALKFVVSTVSTTLISTSHNQLYALWNVIAFFFTFAMLMFVAPKDSYIGMFVVLMLTDLVLYVFYYMLIWRAAGKPQSQQRLSL